MTLLFISVYKEIPKDENNSYSSGMPGVVE